MNYGSNTSGNYSSDPVNYPNYYYQQPQPVSDTQYYVNPSLPLPVPHELIDYTDSIPDEINEIKNPSERQKIIHQLFNEYKKLNDDYYNSTNFFKAWIYSASLVSTTVGSIFAVATAPLSIPVIIGGSIILGIMGLTSTICTACHYTFKANRAYEIFVNCKENFGALFVNEHAGDIEKAKNTFNPNVQVLPYNPNAQTNPPYNPQGINQQNK